MCTTYAPLTILCTPISPFRLTTVFDGCGKVAADAFCRSHAYDQAIAFEKVTGLTEPTIHMLQVGDTYGTLSDPNIAFDPPYPNRSIPIIRSNSRRRRARTRTPPTMPSAPSPAPTAAAALPPAEPRPRPRPLPRFPMTTAARVSTVVHRSPKGKVAVSQSIHHYNKSIPRTQRAPTRASGSTASPAGRASALISVPPTTRTSHAAILPVRVCVYACVHVCVSNGWAYGADNQSMTHCVPPPAPFVPPCSLHDVRAGGRRHVLPSQARQCQGRLL